MITQPQPKKKSKKSVFAMIFFIVAVLLLIIVIAMPSDEETKLANMTKEQLDSVAEVKFVDEQSGMAYQMSKQFLNEKLVSPGTADYPMDLDKEFVNYVGDSTFHVKAYVDSQNGFGAMIRTKYTALLKYNGNDNWSLKDLNIIER